MKAVIICAAPETNIDYILEQCNTADIIICADGGLKYADMLCVVPDLIVGDFDSYNNTLPNNIEVKPLSTHKDNTDTFACIDEAIARGYNQITLLCAIGGRLDHTFANLTALDYMLDKGVCGEIISATERIRLLNKGNYRFDNMSGRTFSLFAFNCNSCNVSYSNVEYPLQNYTIKSSFPLGISNVFTGDNSNIIIHSGRALLVINN